MSALTNAAASLADRLTPALLIAKLAAMAAMLKLKPTLRHHLADRHPLGTPFIFQARFQFSTRDGKTNVHAVCSGGGMSAGPGKLSDPDVTVRFNTPGHMRAFFSSGSDIFQMLLRNEISFDGNLSYLAKFGHISEAIRRNSRKAKPDAARAQLPSPRRWQDLSAPRTGEPCRELPSGEVEFLSDPFIASLTLDALPRIKRLLWAHRTVVPEICTERPRLLTEFMLQNRKNGEPAEEPVLRQARALKYMLSHKRAIVHDDDLLLGTTTSHRIGVVIYPECGGTALWPELLTMEARALNSYRISEQDIAVLDRQVFPFWMEENVREWTRRKHGNPLPMRLDDRFVLYFMWKTQAVSHTIIDLPMVLCRGLLDIREEARRREAACGENKKRAFYQALQIALEGVLDYSRRLAARARELADEIPRDGQDSEARRQELREMADIAERVPAHPAATLREALQATWLLFLCQHQESTNAGLSIGRLDTWLNPFLRNDLLSCPPGEREHRIRQAIELVCAFMLKATDHLPMVPDIGNRLFGGSSSDQVITLGGLTPEGESAVCDLTWIFLKATEMLRLRDPNMNARYAPGKNSEAYLRRLCEVNLLTGATPSIHNDNEMVPALLQQGFAVEHARDWGATGCVEPTSCGRHFGHTNSMMFNMVAPLEMALHDGVHPLVGERVGPATGDPTRCRNFEEFLQAYLAQLGWLIDRSVEINNLLGQAHQQLRPTPLLSALFTGPMESGRDLIDGGARYNTSGVAMVGLTDVIDSLAAIQTLVFERRSVDFATLLEALHADFAGHERLHAEILQRVPKFGQDQELSRSIATRLIDFIFQRYQGSTNYRGGRYLPGYWSMSNHVAFGTLSGALPSGRKRGKAFTPGLTPSPLSGAALTEQIRSVASLGSQKMPNNLAFNVKVVPGAGEKHSAVLDRMAAYLAAYFDLGGMQMQFNVVSTDTLRRAMARPEEYRDLLVRISGYNAYFVDLNRDMQIELIERTEHSLSGQPA